jgi:hypothetical protein
MSDRAPFVFSTGRVAEFIPQPNGSTELRPVDGQPMTDAEWDEYCAHAKAVCAQTAETARKRRADATRAWLADGARPWNLSRS